MRLESTIRWLSRAGAALVTVGSAFVLAGWLAGAPVVTHASRFGSMKANTTLGLVVAGVILLTYREKRGRTPAASSVCSALYSSH